jgi:beta-lactamase class A
MICDVHAQDLGQRIGPLIEKHQGSVCVAIKHLGTGETYLHREKEVVPTASLIKFPVLVEYYRQRQAGMLPPDLMVTLQEADKVPGSGILTDHFLSGTVVPLETVAHLMITYSDNPDSFQGVSARHFDRGRTKSEIRTWQHNGR